MITKDQALTENEFHAEGRCHRTVGPRGGITETSEVWRRNGQTKVWKTRPDEFRLPLKFGIRSYDVVTHRMTGQFHVPNDCPLNDPNWTG